MSPDPPSPERPFLVSPKRRARRSPDQIRERIYRVALRRIRELEFDDTPVSGITREADVAKGTFFNHFPTKEHLLSRVLHEKMDRVFVRVIERIGGTDAIAAALDDLALELAGDPPLARAIVPRLPTLPPPATGSNATDEESPPEGSERLRRWIRDRLAESLQIAVPLEDVDDETLSVLLLATFEVTLRDWVSSAKGDPPFPRGLLHDRIAYLLVSAGFSRPPAPS
jgi:AcrR family transcriptional regulator